MYFKNANELTDDENIEKPKVLYYLALGNYAIGQIEKSYKIAYKAKRRAISIINSSVILMDNMQEILYISDIDALIKHITENFTQLILHIDISNDDINENELDFSLLSRIYKTVNHRDGEVLIDERELASMTFEECHQFKKKFAKNGDIESLLTIAKYNFIHKSAAINEYIFLEMLYYYGRLHRVEELKEFLKDKELYLLMLSDTCKDLANNLFSIGLKFPYLNEQELSYIEQKWSNTRTFELFDFIMFDSDKLERPLKKFDKSLLNKKNSDFSRDFLLKIFNYFSVNEELDEEYSEIYVYNRVKNKIITKKDVDIELYEYPIVDAILANEFYNLIKEKFGETSANYCIKRLSFGENLKSFKESNSHILSAEDIEEVLNEHFLDSLIIEDIKAEIALFWLNKINSYNIKLL